MVGFDDKVHPVVDTNGKIEQDYILGKGTAEDSSNMVGNYSPNGFFGNADDGTSCGLGSFSSL